MATQLTPPERLAMESDALDAAIKTYRNTDYRSLDELEAQEDELLAAVRQFQQAALAMLQLEH